MNLLLDTHLLLWAAGAPDRMPGTARRLIEDRDNTLIFSVASLWEITNKRGLDRDGFKVDPRLLRRGLIDNGYVELVITGEHAVAVESLPAIHRDPFDRLLIAQATIEGITLLTTDAAVAAYPGPIQAV